MDFFLADVLAWGADNMRQSCHQCYARMEFMCHLLVSFHSHFVTFGSRWPPCAFFYQISTRPTLSCVSHACAFFLSNQYAANALVCVTCRNYLTIYHMQELFDCGDITCDGDALESAQVYVAVALFPHAARFLMATLQ